MGIGIPLGLGILLAPRSWLGWVIHKLFTLFVYSIVGVLLVFLAPFMFIKALSEGDMDMAWGAFMFCCMLTFPVCYGLIRFVRFSNAYNAENSVDNAFINAEAAISPEEHRTINILLARAQAGESKEEMQAKSPREWAIYMDCNARIQKAQLALSKRKVAEYDQALSEKRALQVIPAYLANGYTEAKIRAEHPEDWAAYVAGKAHAAQAEIISRGKYGWGTMILAMVAMVLFIAVAAFLIIPKL